MNICGTDRDPTGITCAPGYQQFVAARQAAGLSVPNQPPTPNDNHAMLYVLAAIAALVLLRR